MSNTPKQSQSDSLDFAVSEEEVAQVIVLAKERYDIDLPNVDGVRVSRLIKKLDWWQNTVSGKPAIRPISDKMLLELQEILRQDHNTEYGLDEVRETARALITIMPLQEKQRIADEIRGILVEHRPIENDPVVTEMTAELLLTHYGIVLNPDQLEQLIQFITRRLWLEEGLEHTMRKCLDDLLKYIDKRSRNKRANGLDLHDSVRKAFDQAVSKLVVKGLEPLYPKD